MAQKLAQTSQKRVPSGPDTEHGGAMLEVSSALDWRAQFTRLEGAYAPGTIQSYFTDIEAFVGWCEASGTRPFPADPEVICGFLEAQSCDWTFSTVRRRLYAIRKGHRLLGLPDPTGHEDIHLSLRRIKRSRPTRVKQARGLTREHLDRFLEAQPSDPWGLRNRALFSLGYDLLARQSELVALCQDDIRWRKDGTLQVIIRRSKSDPFGEGRIAFTSKRSAKLVTAWLEWRGTEIRPLFCPIYKGCPIDRSLSTTTIKRVIKATMKTLGMDTRIEPRFSGHSMRVGAAQDLLCAGFDTAAIMRAGGWKTIEVLARYLEYAEHNVWEV